MSLKNHIKRLRREYMLDHHRVRQAEKDWLEWKGYPIDWDNPRDINEKIQWLLCFSDTSSWSVCADKFRVRDYVKSKGLEGILIPLLGVWDSASEIDFGTLPDKCVLKCNHDSGSTLVMDRRAGFDEGKARAFLHSRMKKKFGYLNGEMTFASYGGKMDFYTQEYLEELGRQCILPVKKG